MKKKKSDQNVDDLILGIKIILKNRYSLSDEDSLILKEVIEVLQASKGKKKGLKSNKDNFDIFIKIVELITKFLILSEDVSKITDLFK